MKTSVDARSFSCFVNTNFLTFVEYLRKKKITCCPDVVPLIIENHFICDLQ